MFLLFGIGLPATVKLATGLLGTALGNSNAKSQLNYQAQLQRQNWEYAQSNAHQLEVQDLKNAGLNPILSATNSQLASLQVVKVKYLSLASIKES